MGEGNLGHQSLGIILSKLLEKYSARNLNQTACRAFYLKSQEDEMAGIQAFVTDVTLFVAAVAVFAVTATGAVLMMLS